jgi:prevent-host-death family protein
MIMDLKRDIHSLTEFKKNTPEFLKQLKDTGDPVVLTVNGKAELVVQDAASYQKLLDLAEDARVVEGIRQGLEDMKVGRTISLDAFKEHARKEHGISV